MEKNQKPKDETIQIRLTKDERQALLIEAQLRGVTLSSLIRSYFVNARLIPIKN